MPGLSAAYEDKLLDAIFKTTTFGLPANIFVSLHSADPGDTGTSEISGGSYARVQRSPDPDTATNTSWNAKVDSGTARRITNNGAITFPTATANWNGGSPLTHFGLWDALTGGTFIGSGPIDAAGVVVLNGNTLSFQGGTPGSLRFDID